LYDVVRLLLSRGADCTIKGGENKTTPLQQTVLSKNWDWERCQQLLTQAESLEKFNMLDMERQYRGASTEYHQHKSRQGQQDALKKLMEPRFGTVVNKRAGGKGCVFKQLCRQQGGGGGGGGSRENQDVMTVPAYVLKKMLPQHNKEMRDMLMMDLNAPGSLRPYITPSVKQRLKILQTYLNDEIDSSTLSEQAQRRIIEQARRLPSTPEQSILRAYSNVLQQDYNNPRKWPR
jgi:hypothetical protein